MSSIDTLDFKLIAKDELGPYTLLTLEHEQEYAQNPGQYCIVHYNHNGQTFTRPYSIASEPRTDGHIELCVMHNGDEQTGQAIKALSIGSNLEISPAGGRFQIPEHNQDACFIAGGSGITPLRSMIRWRLQHSNKNTSLLFGCRSGKEIPYYEDLAKLCEKYPNFKVMFYAEEDLSPSVLEGNSLTHFSEFANSACQYFLCGPPPMIEAAKQKFEEHQIPVAQIHTDRY